MSIQLKLLFFYYIFIVTTLLAVSAPPFPFEVEQPDGIKIQVRAFGHEYYSWMETEDGYVIDWVEDDVRLGWYYSELDENGKFTASDRLVTYPAPIDLYIPKGLKEMSPILRNIPHSNSQNINLHETYLERAVSTNILTPLVLLVDFPSLPSGIPNHQYTREEFRQLLFEENLNSDGAVLPESYDMSVRDYYYEISMGNFEISGELESIVDWTTVDHDYSYYVDLL